MKLKLTIVAISILLLISMLAGITPTQAALSYSQMIIASDPERYYRLGETSGTTAIDEAHRWNGSYSTVTLNQPGAIYDLNPSVQLNAGGYVLLPSWGPAYRSFAIELWFYAPSGATNGTGSALFRLFNGTEEWRAVVNYTTALGYYNAFIHVSNPNLGSISANTWYHFVCQFNYVTNRLEVYRNATLIYSGAEFPWTSINTSTFTIGASTNLVVRIDEFALYNRILSQDEINLHYATGFAVYNTATSTITPTASDTPTSTPPSDFPISMGSYQGSITLNVSAGEAANAILLIMLLVGVLFAIGLYLIRWRNR